MEHIQIKVMADASEIVHYDTPDIPLYIKKGFLSYYPDKRAICHWHDDFEIMLILDGEMNYYINGQTILLQKEDVLLINSREMHYGYSINNTDCEFICILFHPSLISANKALFENYILPFMNTSGISYLLFPSPEFPSISEIIYSIYNKKRAHEPFYELDVIGLIYSFMSAVLNNCKAYSLSVSTTKSNDVITLRKMVSYIHDYYAQPVCLNDIAASANICKSKCCSLFQTQIQQTPFDYLNHYRLEKSTELLKDTSLPITAIALNCGFNNSSYYTKLFVRLYHCTPSEYRKKQSS